jgi:SAM-dependent methyltransferase
VPGRRPSQNRPPSPRRTRQPVIRSGGRPPDLITGSGGRLRNHHGFHVLQDPAVVRALVRSAGVGPDDLVLDLGAGPGALTLALARTGARVIAVERDPRLARRLERRTAGDAAVRVVEGDLRAVPLPHRPFRVVANIPFATGTDLLRRLLDEHDRGRHLRGPTCWSSGASPAAWPPTPRTTGPLPAGSAGSGSRWPAGCRPGRSRPPPGSTPPTS